MTIWEAEEDEVLECDCKKLKEWVEGIEVNNEENKNKVVK